MPFTAGKLSINSWNLAAPRFVSPPSFSLTPIPSATGYRVMVATPDKLITKWDSNEPTIDLGDVWDDLPLGRIDLMASAHKADGEQVGAPEAHHFYKVPGFDGRVQRPDGWDDALRRNMQYLLAPARDEVRPYEKGLPRGVWSSYEDDTTGHRWHIAYPAIHHPCYISAYLRFAKLRPDDPLASEASRQARQYGDWLLEHRHPASHRCSLFPYSTIADGEFGGGIEGQAITLFRAARVGESMAMLYEATGESAYLDYARHLADRFVDLQRADGSWPYRVDPKSAETIAEYTSAAITPARLFAMLERVAPNAAYADARRKAIDWTVENPVKTHCWQGMYEDVPSLQKFTNLENWDTFECLRYLLYSRADDARHVDLALQLRDYVEDLFVIWQEETSTVHARCPTPQVIEQFHCFYPMEVHTANWIVALVALHEATGDDTHLHKAIAAMNATVAAQQDSGAFCTWGHDRRFGRQFGWSVYPNCNACAVTGLLVLDHYLKSPGSMEPAEYELFGI